jgi:pyruvate dehydrogenase E2 component (dihydrolipoamide acetyltransferase)
VLQAKTPTVERQAEPLAREQLGVARRVARSNREIPTIDLTATIRMSSVIQARRRFLEEATGKIAFDAFFVSAAARAIKQFPTFAGHADDQHFFDHGSIDVCVAVSRDSRLYLPVVRGADRLSLAEIQSEIHRLAHKTRAGELRPDDLAGGCFTVSNLGMYPIDSFQMIIPPEQSGALAIGAIDDRPVVEAGRIVARPVCAVVLSVDHRMINGALGASFLQHVKEALEKR